MTEPQITDAALLSAMAQGDSGAALEEFYRRHSGMVLGLLVSIIGTRAEAEEVLQDVFVQLWKRASLYDSARGSVPAWVITIARSRALDAKRAKNRRGGDRGVPVENATLMTGESRGPDRMASLNRHNTNLIRAFAMLSDEQRSALEMAYFEGLSHAEIAEREGVPLGTIKSRILLGVKTLRREMSTEGQGGAA